MVWAWEWSQRTLTSWAGRRWGLCVDFWWTRFGVGLTWSLTNLRYDEGRQDVGPTTMLAIQIGPVGARIWSFGFYQPEAGLASWQ